MKLVVKSKKHYFAAAAGALVKQKSGRTSALCSGKYSYGSPRVLMQAQSQSDQTNLGHAMH
jgi:hypothetical protein